MPSQNTSTKELVEDHLKDTKSKSGLILLLCPNI